MARIRLREGLCQFDQTRALTKNKKRGQQIADHVSQLLFGYSATETTRRLRMRTRRAAAGMAIAIAARNETNAESHKANPGDPDP